MRWERFFDDLEDQVDAQWEAERQALASETERVRIAALTMRERLLILAEHRARLAVRVSGRREPVTGTARAVAADWMALVSARRTLTIVPLGRVADIALTHGDLLTSAVATEQEPHALTARIGFAFVLRDLARKRSPVTIWGREDDPVSGTIDRVGADHLDLAVHDLAAPRRATEVRTYRLVPLDAIVAVDVAGSVSLTAVS